MDYRTGLTNSTIGLDGLSDDSRVWIYQSDRALSDLEVDEIQREVLDFVRSWTSHNRSLKATAGVFHNRFVVVFLDEVASSGASGCSIDKLVHFVQDLGQRHEADLMNRLLFYIQQGNSIIAVPMHDLASSIKEGSVKPSDLVFNSLVKNKGEWSKNWLIPIEKSWHARFI